MTKQSLLLRALWQALGATAYIAFVAAFFSIAPRLFGEDGGNGIMVQMSVLLLFVFSVLVMGTLLLLTPLRLYLDGQKTEGVRLLLYTVMWVGAITLLALVVMAVI